MNKLKDIKFKLNIKSIVLFEHLTGKSFYRLTDDDMEELIYAIIVENNPEMRLTESQFEYILGNNPKLMESVAKDLMNELKFIYSTMGGAKDRNISEEAPEESDDEMSLSDIVSSLIIRYGMDAHYVMYEMPVWEIGIYSKEIERYRKEQMTEQRFWTYLQMLPHIDGKKVGGPEKLVPFPWEKDDKKGKAKDFMDTNTDAINNFFNRQKDE